MTKKLIVKHSRERIMDNSSVEILRYPKAMSLPKGTTVEDASVTAAAKMNNMNGGMIALIPSIADLDRLAIDGMEPADILHLTLWFLADNAGAMDKATVDEITALAAEVASTSSPIETVAFGVGLWNWTGDSPAIVLNVADGDKQLTEMRTAIGDRADNVLLNMWQAIVDAQHFPWIPHICLAYSNDPNVVGQALNALGPITFDVLRVAIGTESYDYSLTR